MKNKIDNGGKELVDGLEDDHQVKRIIYRAPRKVLCVYIYVVVFHFYINYSAKTSGRGSTTSRTR